MKNVVVEIQGKHAVVMNDAGDFIRMKNKGYTVGQRLDLDTPGRPFAWVRWAVTAAVALVLLFGGGAYAYYTPYAELSLDINPSIAIKTNIFDTVIDVQALNDDAEQILTRLQIRDCSLQTALDAILEGLVSEGYLSEEEAADIMLTAYSQDQERAQVMLQEMTQILEQDMTRERLQANIEGECIGSEIRTRAQQYGVSPGKLMLAERYAQSTGDPDSVDITQWLGKPVHEVMEAIRSNGASGGFGSGSNNGAANAQSAGSANPNVTADSSSGFGNGSSENAAETGNGYGGNENAGNENAAGDGSGNRYGDSADPSCTATCSADPSCTATCSAEPSCSATCSAEPSCSATCSADPSCPNL